ncbi:MAG: hypothetical protein WC525_06670 [Candidatus Thermoplasmatota archaeon]
MTSVADQYMNEMHDQFKYYATWAPGIPLKIGDVGTLERNGFTVISNLNKLGIDFEVRTDSQKDSLQYASASGVSISTKIKGSAGLAEYNLNLADAGIVVQFAKDAGVAFEARGVEHQLIEDCVNIDAAILAAHSKGIWKDDWVVISDLMVADSGTVLISQGNDASIGLKALADVPHLSLANIDADFTVTYSKNLNTTIICQTGLTPLFKIRGIDHGWFPWSTPHIGVRAAGKGMMGSGPKGKEVGSAGLKPAVIEIPYIKR